MGQYSSVPTLQVSPCVLVSLSLSFSHITEVSTPFQEKWKVLWSFILHVYSSFITSLCRYVWYAIKKQATNQPTLSLSLTHTHTHTHTCTHTHTHISKFVVFFFILRPIFFSLSFKKKLFFLSFSLVSVYSIFLSFFLSFLYQIFFLFVLIHSLFLYIFM